MSDQAAQLRELVERGSRKNGGTAVVAPPPPPVPQVASVPTGVVSFGPAHRVTGRTPVRSPRLAKAIAVASGKGGVGKSNLAVNLSVALGTMGLKVCLLDADLGMANADVLCNLSPRLTLEHVVEGRCRLSEAMLLAPGGFRLIPGASGVAKMADLDARGRMLLLEQLAALERVADVMIIDCGAGISSNVIGFAAAAHDVIVTTTPEPTSMMDAYGMVKALMSHTVGARVELVVNMARSDEEARNVFGRMARVTESFLSRRLTYAGCIPLDPVVPDAVRQRVPFVLFAPTSPATVAVQSLARRLAGLDPAHSERERGPAEREGFFRRLITWLGAQSS